MAFGQQSGPPATRRQVEEVLELVREAGHTDLRDARGALQLTQRQAAGKFTQDEAEALIARLRSEAGEGGGGPPVTAVEPAPRLSTAETALRRMPSDRLAAELQRRGWVVMEP